MKHRTKHRTKRKYRKKGGTKSEERRRTTIGNTIEGTKYKFRASVHNIIDKLKKKRLAMNMLAHQIIREHIHGQVNRKNLKYDARIR